MDPRRVHCLLYLLIRPSSVVKIHILIQDGTDVIPCQVGWCYLVAVYRKYNIRMGKVHWERTAKQKVALDKHLHEKIFFSKFSAHANLFLPASIWIRFTHVRLQRQKKYKSITLDTERFEEIWLKAWAFCRRSSITASLEPKKSRVWKICEM